MEHRITILNRFIAGWCAYFGTADNFSLFEELDEWLRRRLRAVRCALQRALQRALPVSYWHDQGLRGSTHHWHRRHGA